MDLANLRGGPDNISVIVARVTGPQVLQGASAQSPAAAAIAVARPVHPLAWILLGVFALAAVGLVAMDQLWAALVCLIAAGATAAWAWTQRSGNNKIEPEFDGRPLGRGPYVTCNCASKTQVIERLADMVEELREAAVNEKWTVDWDRFRALSAQATAARKASDDSQAARQYLHALSFLVAELKRQRPTAGDDSASVL